jgi:hypothetical protein
MRQLYLDMRNWIALAGLAAATISAGGVLAMRAEAAFSPTCLLTTCEDAHIPGPFFLLWMFATVVGHYLAAAAITVAGVEAGRLVRRRVRPRGLDLALIIAGPLAVAAVWLNSAFLTGDVPPLPQWLAELVLSVVLVPLAVLGTSYLWVGGVAAGVVMLVRREPSVAWSAGILALSLASGAYGAWVLYFNDGRLL